MTALQFFATHDPGTWEAKQPDGEVAGLIRCHSGTYLAYPRDHRTPDARATLHPIYAGSYRAATLRLAVHWETIFGGRA